MNVTVFKIFSSVNLYKYLFFRNEYDIFYPLLWTLKYCKGFNQLTESQDQQGYV